MIMDNTLNVPPFTWLNDEYDEEQLTQIFLVKRLALIDGIRRQDLE